jgi:hypothetical protein
MNFILFTSLLAIASIASAAPGGSKGWKMGDKHENEKWSPIDFTSTFYVEALPGKVVNNVSMSTPGQPGTKGSFKYGIIAHLDIICYVSFSDEKTLLTY